jgi:ribonuclease inhibitor
MDELNLDLMGLQSEEEFHDRAAATFDFPPYYGRNRDAFWDCITDFVNPTTIRVCNLYTLTDSIRKPLLDYLDMLKSYEAESNGTFAVVIEPATCPSPGSPP